MTIPKQATHVIRLHAAWERKDVSDDGEVSGVLRVTLPDSLPIAATTRRVTYERKFNAPSGLSDNDAVYIESALLDVAETITLNGAPLVGQVSQGMVLATPSLQRFNHLVIGLSASHTDVIREATARLLIMTV
jgi:hypothetical protein